MKIFVVGFLVVMVIQIVAAGECSRKRQVYTECGPSCPPSCGSKPTNCTDVCVPGCFCKPKFVQISSTNKKCIWPIDCPVKKAPKWMKLTN